MRIIPIKYLNSHGEKINDTNNNISSSFSTNKNSVNFSGKFKEVKTFINSPNRFKELAKRGHLGCIWCGKKMLTNGELDRIQNAGNRLGNNGGLFARIIRRFQDYLPHQGQIKLAKQIGLYSLAYPGKDLQFLLKQMAPQAERRLIKKQFLIFHKMKKISSKLPKEIQKEFNILMENSRNRILGIPYVSEYSAKEFNYQLINLCKNMPPPQQKKLLFTANMLNHPIFKESETTISQSFLEKVYKQLKIDPHSKGNFISPKDKDGKNKVKLLILNKVIEIAQNNKNQEVLKLCNLTRNKLLGKPTIVKFSNKAFRYKLNEVLEFVTDRKIVKDLNDLSETLPTSTTDKNSFIVKFKTLPNSEIIRNFVEPLRVTLEHITPILRKTSAKELKKQNSKLAKSEKIKKGENCVGNWALAHFLCNAEHGSKNIRGENFPFSKVAGDEYFKTLIEDANNGLLSGESVIKMADNYFEQTGIRKNLKGLRYTKDYEHL